MGSLFSSPAPTVVNMPAPTPTAPPPMPDPTNPAALNAARIAAAARAGRSATILTNASRRSNTLAAGGNPGVSMAPYSGKALGGGG